MKKSEGFFEICERSSELDSETGYYYYGARYYNPRVSLWLNVDPLADYNPFYNTEHYIDGQHNGGVYKAGNLNPYIYCYQSPVKYVDPNGKQVDVIVEPAVGKLIFNVGHTFVVLGMKTKTPVVYTYGRYGFLEKEKGPLNTTNTRGEGVLIKLKGKDAKEFIKKYSSVANAYRITNSNEKKVEEFFENLMKTGKSVTKEGSIYKDKPNAKVIDIYDLYDNNCTTKSIEAVENGLNGGYIEYNTYTKGGQLIDNKVDENKDWTPVFLDATLNKASKDKNSNTKNVNNEYKK